MRISDRYTFDPKNEEEPELQKKALDWALIGAENGGADAQFRVYQLLSPSADRGNQLRALFWLKRSAKNGDANGRANLEECPSIDSLRGHGSPCFGPESN